MSVHMFRVYVGRGSMSTSDLRDALETWAQNHARWTGDTTHHTVIKREPTDGDAYHEINVRFTLDNSKDNLLQKATDKLDNKVEWYRIGYHACTHDEPSPSDCAWESVVDSGNVPSTVPPLV